MKYVPESFDKSKIINSFEKNGNYYTKEFLDGSYEEYYSSDNDEISKIRNEMVAQAKKRQDFIRPDYFRIRALVFLTTSLLSFQLLANLSSNNVASIAILLLIGGAWSFYEFIRSLNISKELIKYEYFLEMYEYIDIIKNLNKEFDAPEFDIENIDSFNSLDIRAFHDIYKKIKKLDSITK